MSFQNLNKDELAEVADFFLVDVVAADEEKGATKKELIEALAAGDEPVTWDQYKEIYLVGKGSVPEAPVTEEVVASEPKAVKPPVDDSEHVLIKYERKNPTLEIVGYTFTLKHPFKSVPVEVAEYLIRKTTGFRLALQSEVTEYYS